MKKRTLSQIIKKTDFGEIVKPEWYDEDRENDVSWMIRIAGKMAAKSETFEENKKDKDWISDVLNKYSGLLGYYVRDKGEPTIREYGNAIMDSGKFELDLTEENIEKMHTAVKESSDSFVAERGVEYYNELIKFLNSKQTNFTWSSVTITFTFIEEAA